MSPIRCAVLATMTITAAWANAGVVLNEVMYNPPDDLDNLQFVELHNASDKPADLSGWKLTKAVRYEFPAGTILSPGGFFVVCKDLAVYKRYYGQDAAGSFDGALSHNSERLDLTNADGKVVDSVKYQSRTPWPVAPDGYSASLERICPTAPGDDANNWAPSPLSSGIPKPGGTPGKANASYAKRLPPSISHLKSQIEHPAPGQTIGVEAEVTAPTGVRTVELLYRVAGPGFETPEATLPMEKTAAGKYTATVPAQENNRIVRLRVRAVDTDGGVRIHPCANEVCPAMSLFVHEPFKPGKLPFALIVNVGKAEFRAAKQEAERQFGFGSPPSPEPPPRGNSAFVFVSQKSGKPELFDFVTVAPRNAGRKVRLHKHHALDGMTTFNLIYEYLDRFVLAEPLAYELYRRAGNAAPRTDFLRTWVDGRPVGYQLLVEQPNKAFLRHNGLKADGNLYKSQWVGRNVRAAHEKKTHIHAGHDDLVQLYDRLTTTRGDEQWAVIKKEFDVVQTVNYYAINMVLSHWDGYFNNYFLYHDSPGTGKWTLYPWDQDKTWGYHDGLRDEPLVFTDMPLTFGMQGDTPPGWPKFVPAPNGIGMGTAWWRPGGYLSKPLLANPTYRKHFLARTKDLLETVYTDKVFFPLIDATGERLKDEVRYRATLQGENADEAVKNLQRNLGLLKEHLTKRSKFLQAQPELQKAAKFDPAELK